MRNVLMHESANYTGDPHAFLMFDVNLRQVHGGYHVQTTFARDNYLCTERFQANLIGGNINLVLSWPSDISSRSNPTVVGWNLNALLMCTSHLQRPGGL